LAKAGVLEVSPTVQVMNSTGPAEMGGTWAETASEARSRRRYALVRRRSAARVSANWSDRAMGRARRVVIEPDVGRASSINRGPSPTRWTITLPTTNSAPGQITNLRNLGRNMSYERSRLRSQRKAASRLSEAATLTSASWWSTTPFGGPALEDVEGARDHRWQASGPGAWWKSTNSTKGMVRICSSQVLDPKTPVKTCPAGAPRGWTISPPDPDHQVELVELLTVLEAAESLSPEDPVAMYLREVASLETLSLAREPELLAAVGRGDEAARNQLTELNLGKSSGRHGSLSAEACLSSISCRRATLAWCERLPRFPSSRDRSESYAMCGFAKRLSAPSVTSYELNLPGGLKTWDSSVLAGEWRDPWGSRRPSGDGDVALAEGPQPLRHRLMAGVRWEGGSTYRLTGLRSALNGRGRRQDSGVTTRRSWWCPVMLVSRYPELAGHPPRSRCGPSKGQSWSEDWWRFENQQGKMLAVVRRSRSASLGSSTTRAQPRGLPSAGLWMEIGPPQPRRHWRS